MGASVGEEVVVETVTEDLCVSRSICIQLGGSFDLTSSTVET